MSSSEIERTPILAGVSEARLLIETNLYGREPGKSTVTWPGEIEGVVNVVIDQNPEQVKKLLNEHDEVRVYTQNPEAKAKRRKFFTFFHS